MVKISTKLLGRNWILIRSCLIFAVIVLSWVVFYPALEDTHIMNRFLQFTAQLTASIIQLFGGQVKISDTIISSADFSMRIGPECTAIVPIILLLGAILAYPSGLRQKLAGLSVGTLVLFTLNQVRTVTLYYIGINTPSFFEIAHFVLWQSAMILVVIGIWLLWVGKMANAQHA
ncbi:exosortase H [Chloroflexota bacterium]